MTPLNDRVIVYRDNAGEWRWTRRADNGEVVSDSAESYTRRWSAKRAAKRTNPKAQIIVQEDAP